MIANAAYYLKKGAEGPPFTSSSAMNLRQRHPRLPEEPDL